jgi:hypothetical protein
MKSLESSWTLLPHVHDLSFHRMRAILAIKSSEALGLIFTLITVWKCVVSTWRSHHNGLSLLLIHIVKLADLIQELLSLGRVELVSLISVGFLFLDRVEMIQLALKKIPPGLIYSLSVIHRDSTMVGSDRVNNVGSNSILLLAHLLDSVVIRTSLIKLRIYHSVSLSLVEFIWASVILIGVLDRRLFVERPRSR